MFWFWDFRVSICGICHIQNIDLEVFDFKNYRKNFIMCVFYDTATLWKPSSNPKTCIADVVTFLDWTLLSTTSIKLYYYATRVALYF